MTTKPTAVLTSPARPNRAAWPATVVRSATGKREILRADRQGGHPLLQRAQRGERAREEAGVGGLDGLKAGAGLPALHLRGRDQHGVFVELAGVDDVAGHRVARIVLEDRHPPARLQQALELGEEVDMPLRRDVMEDAGREDQVEAPIVQGDAVAVIA